MAKRSQIDQPEPPLPVTMRLLTVMGVLYIAGWLVMYELLRSRW